MRRFKTQVPVWLSGVIVTITTITASINLETSNRAEATVVPQIPKTNPAKSIPIYVPQIKPRFCQKNLESAITSIVKNPSFKTARWGILIKPVREDKVLYQFNPHISLIPASNTKLLTTAAAVRIYGDRNPEKLASLRPLLSAVNRYSNNSKANSLLRRIGGQRAARNALSILGLDSSAYKQVDGSGLSRSNRAKPSALVSLLQGMYVGNLNKVDRNLENDLFYKSLAIAGVNGTLRNRFRNTPLKGRLHGKTGTLRGVRTLSGYLENTDYGTIAFSVMVNQRGQSGRRLIWAIDRILLQTARVNRCD
ncbi:MAG: D-alanyl-D-alanine carboxypeptidase [Rivularia sp. (in: Bacteria)]|nr:D-alanyl-D-alanine carboxypeptidase [Rivularia sp. MS3]